MLNPLRDYVLVKEIMLIEEEITGLLNSVGDKVSTTSSTNNGTTRYGHVISVGPENKDVVKNQIVHFSFNSGEIVGFKSDDFILLQKYECTMVEDPSDYIAPKLPSGLKD